MGVSGMRISMIPSNDVKTIHASQNDTQREWSFEPFDNNGTLIIGEESLANITRIKGNTLAFNQLVQNGNFASTSGWSTVSSASLTISNNIANITTVNAWSGFTSSTGWSLVSGHKYLFSASYKIQTNNYEVNVYSGNLFDFSAIPCVADNQWHTIQQIIACTQSGQSTRPSFDNRTASGSYSVKNIMLIDLTQMFGAGKEPTLEQFRALFPLPYYSYQSTLLPFKGTSIKTVGKNLLDLKYSRPYHVGGTYVDSGITSIYDNQTIKVSGTATATTFVNLTFYSNVGDAQDFTNLANKRVKMSAVELPSGTAISIQYFRSDGTYTGVGVSLSPSQLSGEFTMPSDAVGLRSYLQVNNGTTVDFTLKVMLTFADAEQTFEPYKETTTDLPTLTYFPNGMKSARNVYDELLPNKAITRVGMVDLGTLNYTRTTTQTSGVYRFIGSGLPSDIKLPANNGIVANMSSIYTSETVDRVYNGIAPNMSVSLSAQATFHIRNDSYTTAEAFKSAMSGVYLYYELKEYVETDINTEVFYPVYQDGAEQILPSALMNGVVDLGTLTWTYSTDEQVFSANGVADRALTQNGICSKYENILSWGVFITSAKGLFIPTNSNLIRIRDTSYTDANSLKSSLNGVYLYYEKSDPSPTTSPFIGDIYYADGLKTDQTFLYRQTPINYNTRQFALVSKNTETPLTLKDGKGYCNSPLALTNESGFFDAKLKMTDSDGVCYSEKFQIHVERRP